MVDPHDHARAVRTREERMQASPKQRARFFALAHDLGFEARVVKERAKQRFGVASFNDLTAEQLGTLIDRLLELQTRRQQKQGFDQADRG